MVNGSRLQMVREGGFRDEPPKRPWLRAVLIGVAVFIAVTLQLQMKRFKSRKVDVDEILLQEAAMRELKAAEPDIYEGIKKQAAAAADPNFDIAAFAQVAIVPTFYKYLKKADDAAVLRFGKAMVRQVNELSAQSVDVAYRVTFPDPKHPVKVGEMQLSLDLHQELDLAFADVIRTGHAQLKPPAAPEEMPEMMQAIVGGLNDEERDALAAALTPKTDLLAKSTLMKAVVHFYSLILEQPDPKAAQILRSVLAQG